MSARTRVVVVLSLVSGLAATPALAAPAYTVADVQKHATPADCWSIVANEVYDFTAWIAEHPGGRKDVEGMCGIDATAAFDAKHAADEHGMVAPAMTKYRIGTLTTSPAPAETPVATPSPTAPQPSPAALVRQHRTAKDCWSVVNGRAYDLTSWLRKQSGAATLAKSICGKDGTRALVARLKSASRVNSAISRYLV